MTTRNEEQPAILRDRQGHAIPLRGVQASATIRDLFAEVEVAQAYENPSDANIEAVYSFPLPLGAVLLGLEVEIGGRRLAGQVVERRAAERRYEDAVTDGDTALMLETTQPGLYTLSLGNLMAREKAVVRYRYAMLLSWQGKRLRLLVPATIAPRYGDPAAAGLQPHQVPVESLRVEYPLALSVRIEGDLAEAEVASPSHSVATRRDGKALVVRVEHAVLDRDFVLTLRADTPASFCAGRSDGDGWTALASLHLPPAPEAADRPLALKIVIDCSGSMAGTSIAQARKAGLEILDRLAPADRFSVTLFGSAHRHLFPGLVPATPENLAVARQAFAALDADMGGTEMGKALRAAFALGLADGEAMSPALLLITDGEIWQSEALVAEARQTGHRAFTVGVGSAVAEGLLRGLAEGTGGACELVAPQEGMAERILAQFHRLRQPQLRDLAIAWPAQPLWQTALPAGLFAGDTLHVFAGFTSPVSGMVRATARRDAEDIEVACAVAESRSADLPRVAAARRMEELPDAEKLRLALAHQLPSSLTNYLVVAEREVKAEDLPVLHRVPQMLAAGWGGTGVAVPSHMVEAELCLSQFDEVRPRTRAAGEPAARIEAEFCRADRDEVYARKRAAAEAAARNAEERAREQIAAESAHRMPSFEFPRSDRGAGEPAPALGTPARLLLVTARRILSGEAPTLALLDGDLPDPAVSASLSALVGAGFDEAQVVATLLHLLCEGDAGTTLDRESRRVLLRLSKQYPAAPELREAIRELLSGTTALSWKPRTTATVGSVAASD